MIGCMFSLDNSMSVWPTIPELSSIPELNVKKDINVVCTLGWKRTDGRNSCICREVEK